MSSEYDWLPGENAGDERGPLCGLGQMARCRWHAIADRA